MTRSWNAGQKKALETTGKNVLVSAAAGSGKTSVLTESVIRHVRDEACDLRSMLVVTFSTAAAAEMKQRIFDELHHSAAEYGVRCLRQAELIHEADICTIHSLCSKIIRENFEQAGASPNFYTLSAGESELLQQEALNEVFEEQYESGNNSFLGLFRRYCGRDDITLKSFILKLHGFFTSLVDWKDWYEKTVKAQDTKGFIKSLQWESDLQNIAVLEDALSTGQYILSLLKNRGFTEMACVAEEDIQNISLLIKTYEKNGREAFFHTLDEKEAFGKATYKNMDPDFKDFIETLRNDMKKQVKSVAQDEYGLDFIEIVSREIAYTLPDAEEIIRLYQLFLDRYEEMKQDKNALDFSDLEHKALAALSEPAVCQKYKDKYSYVYVDEYQDTNPVQEEILCRISQPRNRFMVGDLKQSIYRFRQADPYIFRSKAKAYCEDKVLGELVPMNENFRSFTEIIDFVNYIMRRLMSEGLGDLVYNCEEELSAGKKMKGGSISLLLGIKKEEEEEDEETEDAVLELTQTEFEAHMIAREILERMNKTIYDDKLCRERPCEYGDFAVLLREIKTTGKVIKAILDACGIPSFVETDAALLDYPEVEVFIDLLRILDNFRQDIPLLGVMRSGFGGFNAAELADIRIYNNDDRPFFEAVKAYAAEKGDILSEKLNAFINKLQRLKTMAKGMRLEEFLLIAEKETGFLEKLNALENGEGKSASLASLLENAGQAGQSASESLNMFIRFVDDMQRNGRISDIVKSSGGENTVKILSIHKSKGLEFPVVFMPRLNKRFNLRECGEDMLAGKDTGIALKYVDEKTLLRKDTFLKKMTKQKMMQAALSEELRILYVGFTRAKQHLILSGSSGKLQNGLKKWLKPQTLFSLLKTRSYLDWLMPLLLRMEGAECLYSEAGLQSITSGCFTELPLCIKVCSVIPPLYTAGMQKRRILEAYFENLPEPAKELSYQYPFSANLFVPSKRSVTQIKNEAQMFFNSQMDEDDEQSLMDEQARKNAAQRGTITHFVMRHLPFKPDLDIESFIERLQNRLLLSVDEAKEVNRAWIYAFLNHDIVNRIAKSPTVLRELPFCMAIDAQDLGHNNSTEKVIVQGVIDLCFLENGKWVILDYKSDRVDQNTAHKAARKYEKQLDLYEHALRRITGTPVNEKYIYFFQEGLHLLT